MVQIVVRMWRRGTEAIQQGQVTPTGSFSSNTTTKYNVCIEIIMRLALVGERSFHLRDGNEKGGLEVIPGGGLGLRAEPKTSGRKKKGELRKPYPQKPWIR